MARARQLLLLGLLLSGCTGTEGTLVVRHDGVAGGAGSGAGGGPPVAEKPWVPAPRATFAARLDGAVDLDLDVDLFYLDPEQQEPGDLESLRAQGRHFLCYLSAGSVESFRDDADEFPAHAVGNELASFDNERWLDVRDKAVRQLMAERVVRLAERGCSGVPPSSLAAYAADTGFDLTLEDTLDYARWLAERLHAAGMSAGLQGPGALSAELWPTFDFGLAIDCIGRSGCAEFDVFRQQGKPVLYIEFGDESTAPDLCRAAKTLGFEPLITDRGFHGSRIACSDIL